MLGEIEREKSKNRVNGNCSKIIECMSECLRVPASNKYAAWESKAAWANRRSAKKQSRGRKKRMKAGLQCWRVRELKTREDRLNNEAERLEMMQN